MAKILVATDKPFAAIAVKGIREVVEGAGDELILLEKYGEKAKLLEAVKDVDAIIIRSDVIDAEVLDAAKQLKIVVRAGAGYDNVDLAAATAHNVCVMNTPGQNSNAVAELAFGMMVMAVRNFYNGTSGTELKGKKLGIHAYGNVGRNVARIAKGFGMEIYAFDAFCPASAIEADGVKPVASPEELYATCDIVSLHIPATAETKNSINYALVGNIQGRHFAEQFRDAGNISRLVNDPERMAETVVFRDEVIFRIAGCIFGDNLVQFGIVGISKEHRFDIGIIHPDMLHAVLLLVTPCQLMLLDNAIHIIGHIRTDNQAVLCLAVHGLGIHIVTFLLILHQPALFLEHPEIGGSFQINGRIVFIRPDRKVDLRFDDMI